MDKKKVAKQIQDFLTAKGFEFGFYGSTCTHRIGIDYHCALVRPKYSPIDGAYTIAVDPVSVKGWICRMPYTYNIWTCVWRVPYNSPEQLVTILNEKIRLPVGCWDN